MGARRLLWPLLAVAAVLALLVPAAAAAQQRPRVSGAAAAVLVDARDGTVLLDKDRHERRQIASATKLMTALLTLERARRRQVFTGTGYQALAVESKIGLRRGERMRVEDLLEALLLESANDAAVALAEGIAGSRAAFVGEMNRRARELGLRDTGYANPIGLDDARNFSSAADLAALASRLLRDRRFAAIVRMPSAQLESGSRPRTVRNRNELVRERVPPVTGVKTGHTGQAGYVLVGSAGGNGASLVSVVLGAPSEAARDAESLALLRWGLSQYRRVLVLTAERPLRRVAVEHRDERVGVAPASDLNVSVRRGQRVQRRLRLPEELEGPLPAGARVGTVAVLLGDRVVRRVPLLTAAEVPGAQLPQRLLSALGGPLTVLALVIMLGGAIALATRRRRKGGVAAG